MGRYILKRVLATVPVLLCVTFVIFTLMHFTDGDPARLILGDTASEVSSSISVTLPGCSMVTWVFPI